MRRSRLLVGLVFLILASALQAVAAEPAAKQPVETGWLGVMLGRQATPTEGGGVPVSRIVAGSPAERAGLRARDVVMALEGTAVSTSGELIKLIQQHEPRSWVSLTLSRHGRERNVRIQLGVRPADKTGFRLREGWIGLKAIDLPPSLRAHFGAPEEAGTMIFEVQTGSPAEAAGFRIGDVVYEVDGEPVESARQLRGLVAGAGIGNEAEFSVVRWGSSEIVLETRIETQPQDGSEH